MAVKNVLDNEVASNIVIRDGDWGLYVGPGGTATCIRHFGCDPGNTIGNCACGRVCHNCNLKSPDTMRGFRKLVQWKR